MGPLCPSWDTGNTQRPGGSRERKPGVDTPGVAEQPGLEVGAGGVRHNLFIAGTAEHAGRAERLWAVGSRPAPALAAQARDCVGVAEDGAGPLR